MTIFGLSACISAPNPSASTLADLDVSHPDIITLPFTQSPENLIFVEGDMGAGRRGLFMFDSGATRSALYARTVTQLGLTPTSDTITIHGMGHSGARPQVTMPHLAFGAHTVSNHQFAVIDDRKFEPREGEYPVGILGLDILAQYRLYVDAKAQSISLIPNALPPLRVPHAWRHVPMLSNPFIDDGRDLKFIKLRYFGDQVPALLDTGSEFNLMNWKSADYPQLNSMKTKLRKRWKHAGAIGEFEPIAHVRLSTVRAGQMFWKDENFVVMDFDSLSVLGIDNQSFSIAGAGLLSGKSFYIDFKDNILRIQDTVPDVRSFPVDAQVPKAN